VGIQKKNVPPDSENDRFPHHRITLKIERITRKSRKNKN
jgi:hypothetical protein